MKKNTEFISTLLKQLNGKTARVSSGNLFSQGSIEGEVILEYSEYNGLFIHAKTEYNSSNLYKKMLDKINGTCSGKKFSFEIRETFQQLASDFFKNETVTVGLISMYGIKNVETKLNENGDIYQVILEDESGSKTFLRVKK